MNIYVANISQKATEEDLQQAFEAFGQVTSATISRDRVTGQSWGFGYVEMPNKAEAEAAIDGLSGKAFKGQAIFVHEARPRGHRR